MGYLPRVAKVSKIFLVFLAKNEVQTSIKQILNNSKWSFGSTVLLFTCCSVQDKDVVLLALRFYRFSGSSVSDWFANLMPREDEALSTQRFFRLSGSSSFLNLQSPADLIILLPGEDAILSILLILPFSDWFSNLIPGEGCVSFGHHFWEE